MAASQRPDSPDSKGAPQYPGGGRTRVPQPGQFQPNSPGKPMTQAPAQSVPEATSARHVTIPAAAANALPAILIKEGAFTDRADYERTSKRIARLILSGKVLPRKPDGE